MYDYNTEDKAQPYVERPLTWNEFKYCYYIEYGRPAHDITPPPAIGQTIKSLIADGILVQYDNPMHREQREVEKAPLFTRFTVKGRLLFFLMEWIFEFKYPTEAEFETAKRYPIARNMEALKMQLLIGE